MRASGLFLLSLSAAAIGCAVAESSEEMAGGPDAAIGGADAAPPPPDAMQVDHCGDSLANLVFDFEAGAAGFVHDALEEVVPPPVEWPYDPWELGTPTGPVSTCASGGSCFATNLAGNYVQCQRAHLTSPALDVSTCGGENLVVRLSHLYDFWEDGASFDGGTIELSGDGGLSWEIAGVTMPGTIQIQDELGGFPCVEGDNFSVHGLQGFVGSSGSWSELTIPIPASMITTQLRIRFRYSSGVSSMTFDPEESKNGTRPGWYVDDIRVERQ